MTTWHTRESYCDTENMVIRFWINFRLEAPVYIIPFCRTDKSKRRRVVA